MQDEELGRDASQPLNSVYSLIDGAVPGGPSVSRESIELRDTVINPSAPLLERLEAYEDIISIEVGDTSLTRVRNLEREIGVRQIYLKFEGGNPTGTQKDRIAFAQCLDALRRGFDTITLATCGNYGAAIALAAHLGGLRCLVHIPETYRTRRTMEIEDWGAEIVRMPGNYEEAVRASQKEAEEKEMYDANPGGGNTHLQLSAYAEIANEIYDVLHDAPRIVAAPVSNGTMLAGIHKGFAMLHKRGKTSRIPRIVAGSSYRKNPIVLSYKQNLETCLDLQPSSIRETAVNEPLVNWHSFDGDEALRAIRNSGGWGEDISDNTMLRYTRVLREREGMHVLPASTAGLAALLSPRSPDALESDRFVAVITGRK